MVVESGQTGKSARPHTAESLNSTFTPDCSDARTGLPLSGAPGVPPHALFPFRKVVPVRNRVIAASRAKFEVGPPRLKQESVL
jgi:hypothetical protein